MNKSAAQLAAILFLILPLNAYSNESNHAQELRAELNSRWENANPPEFLKNRADMEAEEAGETYASPVYEGILASDSAVTGGKLSAVVDPKIYSALQHQMNSKYLVEVLRAAEVVPTTGRFGINDESDDEPGVYLELRRRVDQKHFAWGDVELAFAYALLDRDDYYINPSWNYGKFDPMTAAPVLSKGRVQYYIRNYLPVLSQNEFVFTQRVSLKFLQQIFVKKGAKVGILREIKKAKIACPVALGWDNLIREI